MSKICLVTSKNIHMQNNILRQKIVELAAARKIGAFFPSVISAGLIVAEKGGLLCSITDTFSYDNCERLLLPDNCWYNGTRSSTPFSERIKAICDIVRYIESQSDKVEMYIGDCGQCTLSEFVRLNIQIRYLQEILIHELNTFDAMSLHINFI